MRAADEDEDEEISARGAGQRLTSIINNLANKNRHRPDCNVISEIVPLYTGDTPSSEPDLLKPRKRRTMNGVHPRDHPHPAEYNNNHPGNTTSSGSPPGVKNERLSPGTPDTLSRSRSVTPSSASYPGTPPAQEHPLMSRNYSDFMRSLAAKYNNANPNDYFRNGYPLLKPTFDLPLQSLGLQGNVSPSPKTKPPTPNTSDISLATAAALLNPFASPTPFPPLIDMSSTHALLAMVRTAKEAEVQGLLKGNGGVKRPHDAPVSLAAPLDLSAGSGVATLMGVGMGPVKRARVSPVTTKDELKDRKEHAHRTHEENNEVAAWTVDDVCSFVSSIDICAEYAQKFRDQRIDGSALPLLTEDHLTSTMGLKLGPALKLRSLLAKRTGSCSVCLHCVHCHTSTSSAGTSASPTSPAGASSDREDGGLT